MRDVEGIDAVTSFRAGQAEIAARSWPLQGVTADTVDRTLQLEIVDGDLAALAEDDRCSVDADLAEERGWQVG